MSVSFPTSPKPSLTCAPRARSAQSARMLIWRCFFLWISMESCLASVGPDACAHGFHPACADSWLGTPSRRLADKICLTVSPSHIALLSRARTSEAVSPRLLTRPIAIQPPLGHSQTEVSCGPGHTWLRLTSATSPCSRRERLARIIRYHANYESALVKPV